MIRTLLFAAAIAGFGTAALAEEFQRISIGDRDGFGFASTAGLVRADREPPPKPADANGNGLLEPNEFLPDFNKDGKVALTGGVDNFDHRSDAELANRNHRCVGCLSIAPTTRGSIWTDLTLSMSMPGANWPDANGPALPNNAQFVFDFTVGETAVFPGVPVFFNLIFADYDVHPAIVHIRYASGRTEVLRIPNQGSLDGLIQARSQNLKFDNVFSRRADGTWRGFVAVTFIAPHDPFTAFDFVELSVRQIHVSGLAAPDAGTEG